MELAGRSGQIVNRGIRATSEAAPDAASWQQPEVQARLIMEAVAVLHARGYGLLKLYCYVKWGISEWRHCVFASDTLPQTLERWSGPQSHGSIPSLPKFEGTTKDHVANCILAEI